MNFKSSLSISTSMVMAATSVVMSFSTPAFAQSSDAAYAEEMKGQREANESVARDIGNGIVNGYKRVHDYFNPDLCHAGKGLLVENNISFATNFDKSVAGESSNNFIPPDYIVVGADVGIYSNSDRRYLRLYIDAVAEGNKGKIKYDEKAIVANSAINKQSRPFFISFDEGDLKSAERLACLLMKNTDMQLKINRDGRIVNFYVDGYSSDFERPLGIESLVIEKEVNGKSVQLFGEKLMQELTRYQAR